MEHIRKLFSGSTFWYMFGFLAFALQAVSFIVGTHEIGFFVLMTIAFGTAEILHTLEKQEKK